MNDEKQNETEATGQINLDGRTFRGPDEPDVFIPQDFWRKLSFVIFSVAILVVGVWELWGPLSRSVFGESGEGRVVRIVRETPGEPAEIIRIRREIEEGDYSYDTLFRHFVEVIDTDGNPLVFELAVASRYTPYALVNESFEVIYFTGEEYAYGLWQYRTWAFGCALVLMGLTFLPLSLYLFNMVGKPIEIDPEDPEQLEKERLAVEGERAAAQTN